MAVGGRASSRTGNEVATVGLLILVYANISAKKLTRSLADFTRWMAASSNFKPSAPRSFLASAWAVSQAGIAFSISRLPSSVSRNGWERPSSSQDFEPPVRHHPLDGAAQGGRVEFQDGADLGGPGHAEFGGDGEGRCPGST